MTLKDCDGCSVKAELAWYKDNYMGMKTRTEIEKELAERRYMRDNHKNREGSFWAIRDLEWVLSDARTELLQKLAKIEMERSEIKQKIEDLDRRCEL